MDMNLIRFHFTWSNRRLGENHIQIHLDRFLVSQEGLMIFGVSMLTTLPKIGLDHNPLLWEALKGKRVANNPFRFELMWLTQEDLQDKIKDWRGWSFKGSKSSGL